MRLFKNSIQKLRFTETYYIATLIFFSAVEERKDMKDVPFIVIEPLFSREFGPSVVKQVQDTLNLTCTVFYSPLNLEPRYNITWTTPISLSNR